MPTPLELERDFLLLTNIRRELYQTGARRFLERV